MIDQEMVELMVAKLRAKVEPWTEEKKETVTVSTFEIFYVYSGLQSGRQVGPQHDEDES